MRGRVKWFDPKKGYASSSAPDMRIFSCIIPQSGNKASRHWMMVKRWSLSFCKASADRKPLMYCGWGAAMRGKNGANHIQSLGSASSHQFGGPSPLLPSAEGKRRA